MLRCRSSCTLDLLTLNQMVQGSSAVCVAKGKVAARDLWVWAATVSSCDSKSGATSEPIMRRGKTRIWNTTSA